MIVDSSALIAIALNETPSSRMMMSIFEARSVSVSAANWLETWMVLDRRNDEADREIMEEILAGIGLAIAPVTLAQVEIARLAWRRYGKGTGHPARLNFGDCFAYALATELDEPLLFIGDDFIHTDVRVAT
ncbi:MAG: type II toxin-antitoxin system VapC family toxin [Thermomicrobiales bacterium]|nr:type II toxin-antitoxin system VapC family toxin [Thermomicrobiales bacterium]